MSLTASTKLFYYEESMRLANYDPFCLHFTQLPCRCFKIINNVSIKEVSLKNLLLVPLLLVPTLSCRLTSGAQQEGVSLQHFPTFSQSSPAGIRSPSHWAACCWRPRPAQKTRRKNDFRYIFNNNVRFWNSWAGRWQYFWPTAPLVPSVELQLRQSGRFNQR